MLAHLLWSLPSGVLTCFSAWGRGFFIDFSHILCYNTSILASRLMQIVVIRRKIDFFSFPFLQTAHKARSQGQQAQSINK